MTKDQLLDYADKSISSFDDPAFEALVRTAKKARSFFAENGLPQYGTEDYKRTDLSFLENLLNMVPDACFKLNYQDNCIDCIRKQFNLPSGSKAFIGTLRRFAYNYPALMEEYFASLATPDKNGLVAFISMLISDGLVVYLPKGETIAPLLNFTVDAPDDSLALRRVLIIMGEGSKAQMAFRDVSKTSGASAMLVEVFAEKQSQLELIFTERSERDYRNIGSIHIQQKAESTVKVVDLAVDTGMSRYNYFVKLLEERAYLDLSGAALLQDGQHSDRYTLVEHLAPNCKTDELFKFVVEDESRGVFSGRIYVDKIAQKTEAYQNCRNLLLSSSAKMHAKPQLEIYADDVKCSHGMTIGQLDESALFYMQQRGVSKNEAIKLLSIAFMQQVIQKISDDTLREKLLLDTERRFRYVRR